MSHIIKFSKISRHDAHLAGGKGASLGELVQAGIPVPPGFVVVSDAFEGFIESVGLREMIDVQLGQIDWNDSKSIEAASRAVQEEILRMQMGEGLQREILEGFDELGSEFVAVRSSATAEDGAEASWAGELESFLNTSRESLIDHVKKCWASLYTPRAMAYRREQGMGGSDISVAVVVQKMVQSEVSGITFTVHPVTKDPNHMIIEACWGLGEMIVGGRVTPDSYIVRKSDSEIIDVFQSDQEEMLVRKEYDSSIVVVPVKAGTQRVANILMPVPPPNRSRQKLSDDQIRSVATICTRIESHYGFPCDIEWAMERGELFVVQSRPITTL